MSRSTKELYKAAFEPAPRAESSRPPRDDVIDLLRGFAVVTMIAANLSAKALAEPHPLWFRCFGSFAAPLFVLLAGMMIQKGHAEKNRGLSLLPCAGWCSWRPEP